MTTKRTPDEINRSIATLMGWEVSASLTSGLRYVIKEGPFTGRFVPLPDFYHDLNVLRDHPEKMLREAGYIPTVDLFITNEGEEWRFRWIALRAGHQHKFPLVGRGEGNTEAAARTLAAEAALIAMKEAGNGSKT